MLPPAVSLLRICRAEDPGDGRRAEKGSEHIPGETEATESELSDVIFP